jgi:hypothetical protein
MTLYVKIGRRMPNNWFRRQATKVGGLLSFQENIWIIINQSLSLARRKANESKKIEFIITKKKEKEDLHYSIEWLEIIIRGNEEQEDEEYSDTMKLYDAFGKIFKKDMPIDENLAKHFKTNMLSMAQVDEAYKKGYGASEGNNIAQKLLEMGILTHVEWIKDFNSREPIIPIN